MKAVRYHEHGDGSVPRYEDVDRPSAGAVDVAIRAGRLHGKGVLTP
jgi:NADPH:quinone reductase-like Zn-dependent oxidoreductase